MCQYAQGVYITIYYASIAKPNLNSFEYVFAKHIKVHQKKKN
jgi:hypothetical protein